MKKTILLLAIILSMCFAAVPLSLAAVNSPTITASYSNSVITYKGTGFAPGSYIIRLLDGSSLKTITDVTVSSGGSFTATDNITLTGSSYTVYVNDRNGDLAATGTLTYVPSSGGSEGGTTPPTTVPDSGGRSPAAFPVTVNDSTGEVSVVLDKQAMEALIADADSAVSLDLSGIKEVTTAVLSVEAVQALSKNGIALAVKFPVGSIALSLETLASLGAVTKVGGTVTIKAAIVDKKDLKGMQTAQVKAYGTVVNIELFVGDKKIDVPIMVSLPYTLKPNENPVAVRAWYLDDNGNLTDLNGVYDRNTGLITFAVNHQSYFVVGYEPVTLWANPFKDIAKGAWYYDAVAYANYYGLFAGYGGGMFAPEDRMTRAMFVTVLWKLEGAHAPSGSGKFVDVVPGAWYHAPAQWAAENGIVSGVSDGKYAPERAITRQEMALMLMNYANFKSYDLIENRSLPNFVDDNQIDSWAETAVRKLSAAGVLNGSNNGFMPQRDASRAEVAQMFKNFLRFVVN
ncbi:S-layer homology domain-containing protein [Cohnella sp.]|uniref:S-layer homology domain-containing protein n=1 Tax=Cohnella sp. TaxID=1883426 RepID=UPI00356B2B57